MAVTATLHCLTGCAIGEVLGMVLSTALGWDSVASVALSIFLAFMFGYGLTMWSIRGHGLAFKKRMSLALASDTVSITTMEIIDNLFIVIVPGAIAAALDTTLFWWSLFVSLLVAFVVTVPVNKWLMGRGKGHAVMHGLHGEHH